MVASVQSQPLETYSRNFAHRICREVFEGKAFLGGRDILELTPVEQVNYFVLKVLYRFWQQEMLHLKSPYFDYQHPSVRTALYKFMNTLSQHIRIDRAALEPLLAQAAQDTLLLLMSPRDFFHKELITDPGLLSATYLRNTQKYLRINTHILTSFATEFQTVGKEELSSEQVTQLLTKCEEALSAPEDAAPYLLQFDTLFPLPKEISPASLSSSSKTDTKEDPSEYFVEEGGLSGTPESNTALFSESKEQNASESVATHAAIEPTAPTSKPKDSAAPTERASEAISSHAATDSDPSPKQKNTSAKASTSSESTPKHFFSHVPRTQVEDFIRILFNGKQPIFTQAIQDLSHCKDFDAATDMLLRSYGKPHRWNLESPQVKEFFKQVFFYFR